MGWIIVTVKSFVTCSIYFSAALCNIAKIEMLSPEKDGTLIRKFYSSDADIMEDKTNNRLIVKLHRTNHWNEDKILEKLCDFPNQSETVFPNSKLTLFFCLVLS
jgi:hypothetical protein